MDIMQEDMKKKVSGKLYFTSDIHGHYDLFQKLLQKIHFSEADKMIICGDIIDKGPDSIRLAQFIFQKPNIQCILGNHEYAFLKYYWAMRRQVSYDFDAVLSKMQEYFQNDGHLLDWATIEKFDALPNYIEEDEYICVHAGVPLDEEHKMLPLEYVAMEQLVYDRSFKEPNILPKGDKCVFFGHTPAYYVSGENRILCYPKKENPSKISDYYKVHLDMGTMTSGIVGCICMDTMEEFYVTTGKD